MKFPASIELPQVKDDSRLPEARGLGERTTTDNVDGRGVDI